MAPAAPLLVAALLAALLPLCAAQTCEAFAGQPTYCAGRVSYLVYIPPGLSQADLVASLVNLTASFSLIQTISPGCASASADMGCSTAFRRCNASDPQLIPVCDTACNNYNLACPKIGAPLQDCSVPDAFSPGNPLYVSPSQEACTFANLTAGPGPLTCNYPFVPNPNIDECVIKCPTPGLDDPTYSKIYQVSGLVLSSISIVCLALLLMSGIATWDQRRAYAYFHVGALGIQLIGVWIGRWLPYDQWACTSPWQGRDQSNTAGALQAGLLMYGTHAAAMWNLVLVYTLLLRITENRYQIFGPGKFVPIDPEIVYGIVGWFLWPVPFTVAMFAGNWAKSAGWVVLPDAQAGAGWIFLALYIIPLTILASVQFTLMGLLFYYIARHAGIRGIQSQVRLVILCIHYIVRVLFGTIFSYVQHADRDKTRKRIEEWVLCQVNPLGPGCPKPDLGYIGGVSGLVNALFVTTSGIVILLIFLDTNMLRVWWRWLRCGGFSPRSGTGSTSLVEEQSGTTSSRY